MRAVVSRAALHAFHLRRQHWVEGLGPGRLLDPDFDDDADDAVLAARETIASGRCLQLHPDARHHYPSPLHGPDGRRRNRKVRPEPTPVEVRAAYHHADKLVAWTRAARHPLRRPDLALIDALAKGYRAFPFTIPVHSLRDNIPPPTPAQKRLDPLPDTFRWEVIGGQYLLQDEAKVFWAAQWPPWCTWGVNWRFKHETMRA